MDEARHVEVFAALHREARRGATRSRPSLKKLLDATLATERLDEEGGRHADRRRRGSRSTPSATCANTTEEPLLKELLTYVSRDEARHTALRRQVPLATCVPTLSDAERRRARGLRVRGARLLIDSRSRHGARRDSVLAIWTQAGLDPAEIAFRSSRRSATSIATDARAERAARCGPVRGFVIPTLRAHRPLQRAHRRPLRRDVRREPRRRDRGEAQPARRLPRRSRRLGRAGALTGASDRAASGPG